MSDVIVIESEVGEVRLESVVQPKVELVSDSSNVEVVGLKGDVEVQSTTGPTVELDSVFESAMIVNSEPVIVNIESSGPPGPRGPIGPAGAPGGEAQVIDIATPSYIWELDVGQLIDVVVIDSAGTVIEPGNIKYEGNKAVLTFSSAFSGRAICFK